MDYTTDGVYIEEVPGFSPSIASVDTAIPVFIGYTEKGTVRNLNDLSMLLHKISSMLSSFLFA